MIIHHFWTRWSITFAISGKLQLLQGRIQRARQNRWDHLLLLWWLEHAMMMMMMMLLLMTRTRSDDDEAGSNCVVQVQRTVTTLMGGRGYIQWRATHLERDRKASSIQQVFLIRVVFIKHCNQFYIWSFQINNSDACLVIWDHKI